MNKKFALRLASIPAAVAASVGTAQAAIPVGITTAITDTGVDLVAGMTAVTLAFIAFWGLKKLAGKMGWL